MRYLDDFMPLRSMVNQAWKNIESQLSGVMTLCTKLRVRGMDAPLPEYGSEVWELT
jgi:hypothetical protein